jgi:hypothetical protein
MENMIRNQRNGFVAIGWQKTNGSIYTIISLQVSYKTRKKKRMMTFRSRKCKKFYFFLNENSSNGYD